MFFLKTVPDILRISFFLMDFKSSLSIFMENIFRVLIENHFIYNLGRILQYWFFPHFSFYLFFLLWHLRKFHSFYHEGLIHLLLYLFPSILLLLSLYILLLLPCLTISWGKEDSKACQYRRKCRVTPDEAVSNEVATKLLQCRNQGGGDETCWPAHVWLQNYRHLISELR